VWRWPASALLAATCSALVLAAGPAHGAAGGCARLKETSLHWDAVFGHVSSLSEALVFRKRLQHFGYKNVTFEKDWCDDVEVAVPGVDTAGVRSEFALEAQKVGLDVSFEPPHTYKRPHRGYVKAIFGTRPTLARADTLLQALAHKGFREAIDIERQSANQGRVVLYRVPKRLRKSFRKEVVSAGFEVVAFER
jgi:hypothetical protein